MAEKVIAVLVAALLASAGARSLRLPEARFASLEGFAAEAEDSAVARAPRHLSDFAVFDRPLSPDDQDLSPHHRYARGAAEPGCDCADNPDLVGEIVETAPVMEEPFFPEFAPPPQPAVAYELVEAPEERAGVELTEDDAELEDDQEATLSDQGLHPEDEADVEPCAGRPARELAAEAKAVAEVGVKKEVSRSRSSSEEEEISAESSEEVKSKSKASAGLPSEGEAKDGEEVEPKDSEEVEASAQAVKTEESEGGKTAVASAASAAVVAETPSAA
ncbi:Zinc metalloprotease [Frankliniella fusca]|uniref:Zinc metalloprotease n=1 Tax=Frankliniella fusca TaxID=407009 RepID=A0AAE1HDV1_9NEOP|nr:Zinc metalloprotease [Frankliniella fusca]